MSWKETTEITVEPEAANKIIEFLGRDGPNAVRVFVHGGGCGGMQPAIGPTDGLLDTDLIYNGDGFRLVIDPIAFQYMRGFVLGYRSEEFREYFTFEEIFMSTGGSGTCNACGAAGGCS
jgi:iron-sulfur cluster insertion protein